MVKAQKDVIFEIARGLGFHQVSIGSLEPLSEELKHYQSWLDKGYAAGMDYMKRDPVQRITPSRTFSQASSVVLATVSYYTEKPALDKPFWGAIARYAVGLDYHAVFRKKMRELRDAIARELNCEISGKPFIDSVALYEQGLAARHGLGFAGKHSLIITPKLSGSYCFVGELFLNLELEADGPYEGTCGNCFRCGSACPTGAIVEPGFVDSNLCISYLTIENKEGIPVQLREKLKDWVFGCDICQEVCPYNQKPLVAPWQEFHPQSGAGHYLDLVSLLDIKTEDQFRERFFHTPLRRPKRRGMIRNSLVVLGNHLKEISAGSNRWSDVNRFEFVIDKIHSFILEEPDVMLKEHAYWALAQGGASAQLKKLVASETDKINLKTLACYLESIQN